MSKNKYGGINDMESGWTKVPENKSVGAQSTQNNEFKMELVAFDGDFDVYQDRETGVQYIVYREWKNAYATFCAMTPRYNADGSLYQGGVAHE